METKLLLLFRRTSGKVLLIGYKRRDSEAWTPIDEQVQDVKFHTEVWGIPGLQEAVMKSRNTKKMEVLLGPELANRYISGTFRDTSDTPAVIESDVEEDTASDAGSLLGAAGGVPPVRNRTTAHETLQQDQQNINQIIQMMIQQQIQTQQQIAQLATIVNQLGTVNYQVPQPVQMPEMRIGTFDGSSEEASTWMRMYNRASEINGWLSDAVKISQLKSHLVPGSLADKWYMNRVSDEKPDVWTEWEESFLRSFTQNCVQLVSAAMAYRYTQGSLLDYFYEKTRLLKLGMPDAGPQTVIAMVIEGLPIVFQSQLLTRDIQTKDQLLAGIQRLKPFDKPRTASLPAPQRKVNFVQEEEAVEPHEVLPSHEVFVNKQPATGFLDTGAGATLMTERFARDYGIQCSPADVTLHGFNGSQTRVSKQAMVNLRIGNRTAKSQAYVVRDLPVSLLIGRPALDSLGFFLSNDSYTPLDTGQRARYVDIGTMSIASKGV